ncbi:DNA ligase 1 [Mycetomoellerius zeteki]|uniref:DNA ligase 1 n=1 Tax=Mycetomoellerius zeteki TaxID=64791 RepID=UPI00084E749E|nr:PREDICTED: DNA ligase 1-like [Trachymyrmex zeteki]
MHGVTVAFGSRYRSGRYQSYSVNVARDPQTPDEKRKLVKNKDSPDTPKSNDRNWQSYRGQQINNPRKTRSGYVQIAETQTNGPKYKDAKVYQTISNRDNASKIRNSEPAGKNPVTRYGSSRDVRKNAAMLTETVKPPIKATPYKENARENNLQREKQTAHHKRPLNGKTEDELTDWNEIVELDSNMINKTAKRVQKYKTRNNKSNTEKSIPEKEPMTKAPYYIETMSRRISTESAIEHKNKKEDNTKESQHAKKGQVTTSANIGSRRANIEPCTPRDTSINMTFNESNQCKTVAELINEENKLLDIIQNRAKKRKLIDARTRRINILKQFIQEMSPDNSGDEEQLKQHEEAEKKMMETINFYNKQKDKHRGAAFTQVFADKNQDNIIKLATTLSIEDIKPQSNSSNEQIYRVTYDITQNYTYQYVQTINKEDITNLYHNSTQDASFLRPVKNTTTTTMETEVIQQESSKRDETSSTISESPQTPMQAITTPIKHLQENINKPSTSRYKEIYTTSESNDINKDENYNPTPKRNIKTTTRKRGRPRKVKQPNQYTKTKAALKETIPERQKPTIISDIVLTKNFNELTPDEKRKLVKNKDSPDTPKSNDVPKGEPEQRHNQDKKSPPEK